MLRGIISFLAIICKLRIVDSWSYLPQYNPNSLINSPGKVLSYRVSFSPTLTDPHSTCYHIVFFKVLWSVFLQVSSGISSSNSSMPLLDCELHAKNVGQFELNSLPWGILLCRKPKPPGPFLKPHWYSDDQRFGKRLGKVMLCRLDSWYPLLFISPLTSRPSGHTESFPCYHALNAPDTTYLLNHLNALSGQRSRTRC